MRQLLVSIAHGCDSSHDDGIGAAVDKLAKSQGAGLLEQLIQSARREESAIGSPQHVALACNGWDYSRERSATGARVANLPHAAIADAIAKQGHTAVDKAGPN